MIIRPCIKDDLNALFLIETASFEKGNWSLKDLKYDLEENECAQILVCEEGKVFAYIDFWLLFEQATIAKIAVIPALQNKGIGDILLKDAIKRMIESEVTSITLEVRVSNIKAIKLYQKNGFKILITKKGYYSDGEDAYLMCLKIGEENG